MNSELTAMLKRRGFRVIAANPRDRLFFPQERFNNFDDEIYELLKKYSFRIFMRDLIKNKKSFTCADLLKYVSRECVEIYLQFLLERKIIEKIKDDQFRLKKKSVFSFGETLEWFVAQIFEKEFSSKAMWGVRLKGGKSGGDYDVLASFENRIAYVEVKSSPPANVEEKEIIAFLKRAEELSPSLAIFLEDTQLRMKDKIVPFFENALRKKGLPIERLRDETFSIGNRVYITNSKGDIAANLAFCIRHHLTSGCLF
ncbi:MAG: hypothetical protein OEV42_16845 [Deltaproteobacteria bacterium]|nr:hypothetical protein [Deltaproteobacteria bacterium]